MNIWGRDIAANARGWDVDVRMWNINVNVDGSGMYHKYAAGYGKQNSEERGDRGTNPTKSPSHDSLSHQ